MWISADFIRFCGKKLKKHGKKCRKMPYFGSKTSDFLDRNIRTFDAKPPYFVAKKSDVSGFPAGNGAKIPLFPILRYFGAKQGVVASEAILSPLTTQSWRAETSEKGHPEILHTRPIGMNPSTVFDTFISENSSLSAFISMISSSNRMKGLVPENHPCLPCHGRRHWNRKTALPVCINKQVSDAKRNILA